MGDDQGVIMKRRRSYVDWTFTCLLCCQHQRDAWKQCSGEYLYECFASARFKKRTIERKRSETRLNGLRLFFGQSRFIYNNLSLILPCLCGTAFLYAPLWLLINSELVAPEYFTSLLLVSLIYGFVVSLKLQQQHFLVRCSTNDVFFPLWTPTTSKGFHHNILICVGEAWVTSVRGQLCWGQAGLAEPPAACCALVDQPRT